MGIFSQIKLEMLALYQQIHFDLQKVWELTDLLPISKYWVMGTP